MASRIKTDMDGILIIPGSQMGLDFSGKIFLDKDDIVFLKVLVLRGY